MTSIDSHPATVASTSLTGHELKKLIRDQFSILKPTSAKFCKSTSCWKPDDWMISIETSKVFVTNEEKRNEHVKIDNFIRETIKSRHNIEKPYDVRIEIDWPITIEEVNAQKEEERKKQREEAERIELENKKRKRIEEENAELERVLRPKLVKKDMGTMEEFKQNMRNEQFDDRVRRQWREELNRKAGVLLSYPFQELETMKSELPNIEEYIQGVIPHVASSDDREPFFGNMDRVFRKSKSNICRTVKDYDFNFDTFESCIRLYHTVHRNPIECSIDKLRKYSQVFVV